jgi:hypothetical protein
MGFKVRGYTREVPHEKVRDYSLFAIATEGTEREPDYFRLFDGIDRIKVDIIEPETSDDEEASEKRKASSPSKVLEKVKAYISKNQLSAEDGDSLWCVIDVDRWPQKQIEELNSFCAQKDNWHLVISNPSIEIWLLYHKRTDLTDLGIQTANDAKQALDKIEKGGYYYIKYLPLMLDAIENARNADSNPDGYMPELLQTKVYQLGRALYDRMGKVRFEKFVASLPSVEKKILKHKKDNKKKK